MKRKLQYLALALFISQSLFSGPEINENQLTFKQKYQLAQLKQQIIAYNEELNLQELEGVILANYKMENKFNVEERNSIRKLAEYFDIPLDYIYKLFYIESRGNSKAVNKQYGDPEDPIERIKLGRATGYIQFMPSTAKALGTTTEELYHMTAVEQLEFVKLYLERINPSKKFDSFTDLYLAVLFPKAMDKSDSYILGSHLSDEYVKKVAKQNAGIDKNKDGMIQKSEVDIFANC